jgi:hypothetical protein
MSGKIAKTTNPTRNGVRNRYGTLPRRTRRHPRDEPRTGLTRFVGAVVTSDMSVSSFA